MKFNLYLILALIAANIGFAQTRVEAGPSFNFDYKAELDAQFVLKDNYNYYMLTVVNANGMMANRRMILRKFDQKNQLVDTYNYEFPKFDASTLYDYLGSTETNNGKVIVYTKSYSGKAKKSEIVAHSFDKATAKFTSTVLDSAPIASLGKSGNVWMDKSDNGNYIGIVYTKNRAKNEAEKSLVLVLDNNSQNVAWKKDIEFTNDHVTDGMTVTNSGKVAVLRDNASFKKANNFNYISLVSADGQEDKNFETGIFLHKMKAVSIGTQDYIFAFNATSRGMRQENFTHLLFYDLKEGKTLQNIRTQEMSSIKDLADVIIRATPVQNNEIQIFAEPKVEIVTKPQPGMTTSAMFDKQYTYGPAYLYNIGFDGTLKGTKKLTSLSTKAETSQSYGLLNVKGTYYISTGFQTSQYSTVYNGLFSLNGSNGFEPVKKQTLDADAYRYTYQLIHYLADSSKLVAARVEGEDKMAMVTFTDIKL
ncbi:hypothetical protein [uncultured Flavobacterium sp.]|uniref:hypothetical protein n=1 Tax=uncultured Flavobacterium sp. TaxID=165435 RepID=UPI0025F2AD0C|nr:hypothetical protein [uncultured Flavobacterium sp.]